MWERDFVYIYAYILFRLMVSLGRERLKKTKKGKTNMHPFIIYLFSIFYY